MSETLTTITDLFESVIGICPPEFKDLFYIIAVIFVFYVVYCFFELLFNVFGVTKWKK